MKRIILAVAMSLTFATGMVAVGDVSAQAAQLHVGISPGGVGVSIGTHHRRHHCHTITVWRHHKPHHKRVCNR